MLASRAVTFLPPRPATDGTPTALRWLLAALVVFAVNLGGFTTAVVRDINKTDEAAYEAGDRAAQAERSSAAPGDDPPDALLPNPASPAAGPVALHLDRAPSSATLGQSRRGPSARAPPVHA